jgi:hypothetical protein
MHTTRRFAIAIALLLTLPAARSHASVVYHLDTGLPPGTGLYAEVEFASPPASASSGWSAVVGSGTVLDATVYNLVSPVPGGFSAVVYRTGVSQPATVGSDTGATLDSGGLLTGGNSGAGRGALEAVLFNFGPGGSGAVEAVYFDGTPGGGVIRVAQQGTWVLGDAPPPVPEPASLVLASFPLFLGLACAWRRRRAA